MLRAIGLLVAISVALLLWAVRPSGSRSFAGAESVPAPTPAATRTGTTAAARWTHRPVPRLPDVSSADEADDPDPGSEPDREELEPPYHTDLVDPPDSPDQMVELAEPDLPEDPDPTQAEEPVTEAEAEPDHVPTAADEALVARAVDFFDRFLSAIESNAGNCDRMADSLSDLLSSSRDLIAEGKAMADQPARMRWFDRQMEAKMPAGVEQMIAPLQPCTSNERMMAVLSSFTTE